MDRTLNFEKTATSAAVVAVAVFGLTPLGMMLARSFFVDGSISSHNYVQVLTRSRTWELLLNSLILAGGATLVATFVGVTTAFLIARTTISFRLLSGTLFCLPLLFPPYVLANGWFQALGANRSWLFSLGGGILILSTAFLPVILLLSMAAFSTVNSSLEDAARIYAGWPRVLARITLPLARPGILLAVVLAFLLAIGEFAAPSFLRLDVFPVESFTQLAAFYDSGAATVAAMPLLLLVAGCVAAVATGSGKGELYFRWSASQPPRISLGPMDRPAGVILLITALITVLLPVGALVSKGLSTDALADAWNRAKDSFVLSLLFASIAATAITVLGFLLGYASRRTRWIRGITLALFAMPGTILAFGTTLTWNRPVTSAFYASAVPLLSAMTMQYLAVGQFGFAAGLAKLSPSLEESAQLTGAPWLRRVFSILLPMLRPTTLAVWILAFILSLRDTSLPLLLAPPGQDTLTARTLTLSANGSQELIAALCLFAIALPLFPAAAGVYLLKKWRAA